MAEDPDDQDSAAERAPGGRTYSAREIVQEFFPATPARLVPGYKRYRLRRTDHGNLRVLDASGQELLVMEIVPQVGDANQRLCCDLCNHTAGRPDLALHRVPVPGSNGRRWRYVTSCLDASGCEARRRDDTGLKRLLAS